MKKIAAPLCIFLLSIISCDKEDCIKCILIGNWRVKETVSTFIDDELDTQYNSNYQIEFYNEGTGIYHTNNNTHEDKIYWTLSPDDKKVYVSLNILNDTLSSTTQFEIISSGQDEQIWENEQIFANGGVTRMWQKKWTLTRN